jgi:hypothetical protein
MRAVIALTLFALSPSVWAATAADTFVEGATIGLGSHTPTGPNAGAGWTVTVGSINVNGTDDRAVPNNDAAGNRGTMTTALGDDNMDVQAEFVNVSAAAGDSMGVGLSCRHPDGTSTGAVEAIFWWSLGTVGSYELSDGTLTDTQDEAWPGGTVTFKLECRDGSARLLVNGVEKVAISGSVAGSGGQYAGIVLPDFDGAGNNRFAVDNYTSSNFVAGTSRAPASQSYRRRRN